MSLSLMQHAPLVLLSLACFAFTGQAASMKSGLESQTSSAIALVLGSSGPGKVKTKAVVESLVEVAKGLEAEDKAALDVARKSASDCKTAQQDLKMALAKGKRTLERATEDHEKANAQVDSMKASLAELKTQISAASKELDSLNARLKKMRTDKGLLKRSASSALRQVEAVLEKTYLTENAQRHHGATALNTQVSDLERLSENLSFLQAAAAQKTRSPGLILKTDKMDVVRASELAQRGFNEEEKRILELVEVERKKLQDLEENMEDFQPAISNKLGQAMELQRTIDASKRAQDRDSDLSAMWKHKCSLVEEHLGEQRKARNKVTNDVLMASKLLENMDTALFLAKDIQGLKRHAISLLQLPAGTFDDDDIMHDDIMSPSAPSSVSLSQEAVMNSAVLAEALDSGSLASASAAGPFDKVSEMLSGLIASLKAQANEEVNQHQFCQDGIGENRRHRVAKQLSLDTLASTVRWSKLAILRLDDSMEFCTDEIKRLGDFQAAQSTARAAEQSRVDKEIADHKIANDVVQKVVVILNQLCSLDGSAASLIQHGSKQGSRFSQCKEASNLLKSASHNVEDLDGMTKHYKKEYNILLDDIDNFASDAKRDRVSEKSSVRNARAQRASELATAERDSREATKALRLIDDAKKELEHSCSHTETREEKMARRKEEIDALKEALKVLEGEAIPV